MKNLAKWSIWDLHLHTSKSYDYEIKDAKIEEIIDSVLAKMKVKLMVLTDHMIFDDEQFQIGLKYIENKGYDLTLLPGCEIRIKLNSKVDHIDFLIATSPKNSLKLQKILEKIRDEKKSELNLKSEIDVLMTVNLNVDETIDYFKEIEYVLYPEFDKSCGLTKKISSNDKETWKDVNRLVLMRNFSITHGNPKNIGISKKILEEFCEKNNVDSIISVISSSDNHNHKVFPFAKKENQNLEFKPTFFKALNTFEGLKMVATETTRVNQENQNQIFLPDSKIKRIDFSFKNKKESSINFSPNLNVIIGNRSSGKSMLLSIINKELGNPGTLKTDELNKYDELIAEKSVSIFGFRDNGIVNTVKNKINYYPQNYFIKHFEKVNKNDFTDLMYSLNKKIIEVDTSSLNIELEKIIKEFLKEIKLYELLIKNLENLNDFPIFLNDFYKNSNNIEFREEIYYSDENVLFLNMIKESNEKIQETIGKKQLSNSEIKTKLIDLEDKMKKAFPSDREKIIKNFDQLKEIVLKQINEYSKISKIFLNILEKDILPKINEINLNDKQVNEFDDFKNFYNKSFLKLGEIMADIDFLNNDSKEKKQFEARSETYISKTSRILKKAILSIEGKKEQLKKEIFYNDYIPSNNIWAWVEKVLQKEKNKKLPFYGKVFKVNDFEKKVENFFEIDYSYDFIYNDEKMTEVSPGKKAEILINNLLSDEMLKNKTIIMIDQPEDSLDNRYIATALVQKIRDLKTRLQIIIATHNVNLVVNADAENVIYADKNNSLDTIYFNGALEFEGLYNDKNILQLIAECLEGGKRALNKRLNTYEVMLDNYFKDEDIKN